MTESLQCAGIVYARTYEVDFRFIAVPAECSKPEQAWLTRHIFASMRSPETLPEHPRWVFCQLNDLCLIGVVGLVRDLARSSHYPMQHNITAEFLQRPTYTFLGYITRRSAHSHPMQFPAYSDHNLKSFAPLLQCIEHRWWVKSYEDESQNPIKLPFQPITFVVPCGNQFLTYPTAQLNLDETRSKIWEDSSASRMQLWQTAVLTFLSYQPAQSSLCFGTASVQDVQDGCFLNATILGRLKPGWIQRLIASEPEIEPANPPLKSPPNRQWTAEDYIWAVLSLPLGFVVGYGLAPLLAGISEVFIAVFIVLCLIGWIVFRLLHGFRTRSQSWQQPENPVQPRLPTDVMYGLKPKDSTTPKQSPDSQDHSEWF